MRVFVFAGVTCALAMPACGASLKIGKSEAGLNILSFEGYAQNDWVKPFEAQTGCKVVRSYAGSTDEMLTLMKTGGGAQYDVVSAGADSARQRRALLAHLGRAEQRRLRGPGSQRNLSTKI